MLIAGLGAVVAGGLNLLLWYWLRRRIDAMSATRGGLTPDEYLRAREEVRGLNPWSLRGQTLRAQVRETDHPGAAKRSEWFWVALSASFLLAGVAMVAAALL